MKKLRKTLAIVLAAVMLISVIPFSVNAQDADAAFTIATVNSSSYDSSLPINSGDTITVDVSLKRSAEETISAWMLGYSYDAAALELVSVVYDETNWTTFSDEPTLLGGVFNDEQPAITDLVFSVATITFTVKSDFTGATAITANAGGSQKNYFIVETATSLSRQDVEAAGAEFTVYEKTDKAALLEQLQIAATKQEAAYTPSSWKDFPAAVASAQAVYDNAFASQQDVNDATSALTAAIAALTDKAILRELLTAINTAKQIANQSGEMYTAESIEAYREVITAAEAMLDDEDVLQADVDAMVLTLTNGITTILKKKEFTVRFHNGDGSVMSEQTVIYGESATAPEETPTKASDAQYNYAFSGWDRSYTAITGPELIIDILPEFTHSDVEYTVYFVDENDNPIETQTYTYNQEITPPQAPEKPADKTYTYTFAGWDPVPGTVTEDQVTYKATYRSEFIPYTVRFVKYNGDEYITYENLHYGDVIEEPAGPEREKDNENIYTFKSWDKQVVPVEGDATYTATYDSELREYDIIFMNGEEPFRTYKLHWNDEVIDPEENPTKEKDNTYSYTFTGWTPERVNVTGDAVYYAVYDNDFIPYTVSFVNYDGSPIQSATYHYGDEVIAPAQTPVREQDDEYTYTFTGWDVEPANVSADITYTAQFEPVAREYDIAFVNYDGSPLKSAKLHWGDEVTEPEATPEKEGNAQYHYVFTGWDAKVVPVAGHATYTAQFDEVINTYFVHFLNYDDTEFTKVEYEYGAIPTDPEGTPVKPNDAMHYYTFISWGDGYTAVTGECSYKANFFERYLPANYDAVYDAQDAADVYTENSDKYTEKSYERLFNAVVAVQPGYTIDKQAEVEAMAAAIRAAIDALVSDITYSDEYAKCVTANKHPELYTAASYESFAAAFAAIGAKQDFNTDEATQAQVDLATKELTDAYALLEASTLKINGQKELLDDALLTECNATIGTTRLFADDGGAGTAELKFYDVNGDVFTNQYKRIGTGFTVQLLQFGEVKFEKTIIVYGDINGDGQVSVTDIALVEQMLENPGAFNDVQILAAKCGGSDINLDRVIELALAL